MTIREWNNQKYEYGHDLAIRQIQEKMPFRSGKIKREYIDKKEYTKTFDPLLAYAFYLRGYPVVMWGVKYKKRRVFIFKKPRITVDELPF